MVINLTLKNFTYSIISILGIGYLLNIGAPIILPLIFGVIFAIFLYPIDRRILKIVKIEWLSILLSFLCVIIPLTVIGIIFSYQLLDIIESLPSIQTSIKEGFKQAINMLNTKIPLLNLKTEQVLSENLLKSGDGPFNILKQGIVSSTTVIANIFITIIYTFLILYYRISFRNFIIYQFEKSVRKDIRTVISRIKVTIQAYIGGLGLVIIILSIMNTIGLYLIGIEYPIFWGTLAGLLAIIPYIGTALGGILPFLYSLATTDDMWQPIAIFIYYGFVQALEGNIITPKIVGDKVNINPLFAILSILFFGSLWGVGGVILALPMISIIRIILTQFDSTLPFAVLMSSKIAVKADKFKEIAAEQL